MTTAVAPPGRPLRVREVEDGIWISYRDSRNAARPPVGQSLRRYLVSALRSLPPAYRSAEKSPRGTKSTRAFLLIASRTSSEAISPFAQSVPVLFSESEDPRHIGRIEIIPRIVF